MDENIYYRNILTFEIDFTNSFHRFGNIVKTTIRKRFLNVPGNIHLADTKFNSTKSTDMIDYWNPQM